MCKTCQGTFKILQCFSVLREMLTGVKSMHGNRTCQTFRYLDTCVAHRVQDEGRCHAKGGWTYCRAIFTSLDTKKRQMHAGRRRAGGWQWSRQQSNEILQMGHAGLCSDSFRNSWGGSFFAVHSPVSIFEQFSVAFAPYLREVEV